MNGALAGVSQAWLTHALQAMVVAGVLERETAQYPILRLHL
jgi:hypothetical protein